VSLGINAGAETYIWDDAALTSGKNSLINLQQSCSKFELWLWTLLIETFKAKVSIYLKMDMLKKYDIQEDNDPLFSRPQLHPADHPEDCKLPPSEVNDCCKIPLMHPAICQTVTHGLYAGTNDDMHTAGIVVCVDLPVLAYPQAHCGVSMAVSVCRYLVSAIS
jgi:hypothetical protein